MNLNETNETNLRDLKETLGLLDKLSKRYHRYANIIDKGFITKQEVTNLKSIFGGCKRNNLNDTEYNQLLDKFAHPLVNNVGNSNRLLISPEHTEQGLKFLKGLYLTPTGKRKKNSALGMLNDGDGYQLDANLVEHVLAYFSHFQFNGFREERRSSYLYSRDVYTPVWLTVATDGQCFEYEQQFSGFWKR